MWAESWAEPWNPDPSWVRLPGSGPSTVGVWRGERLGQQIVVKRLAAPSAHDPMEFSQPGMVAWWRRSADVAASGFVESSHGLRGVPAISIEEDAHGITLVYPWVDDADNPGPFLAHALGRFAGTPLPDAPWLVRRQLRDRLAHVARRGGWTVLARTPVADIADHLWRRRDRFIATAEALPQVAQHGDPVPGNLLGRQGDDVLAIDWATLGTGPVGGDLGYLSLTARESFDVLLDAYCEGVDAGLATRDEAAWGARITAVFTVLTRADWALARVAEGEGALAGKFRHPAVAPYLRSLQRQYDQIEALLAF